MCVGAANAQRPQAVDAQADAPLQPEHAGKDQQVEGRQRPAGKLRRKGLAKGRLAQADNAGGHAKRRPMPGASLRTQPDDGQEAQRAQRPGRGDQPFAGPAVARQPGHQRTPGQKSQQHRQVDQQQALRRLHRRLPHHLRQPGADPQRLQGQQAAVDHHRQRCHADERRVRKDVAVASGQHGRRRALDDRIARCGTPDVGRRQRQQDRHRHEQAAPADAGQEPLHWQRGGDHAERARHQHPRVGALLDGNAEDAAVAGERCHQTGRNAHADQQPRGQQLRQSLGCGKGHATDHRECQKGQQNPAWTPSVQRPAQRQLHRRKAEKVDARQQAELSCAQAQLDAEHRRQCGGDGAHQRRQKVGQRKRCKDRHRSRQ